MTLTSLEALILKCAKNLVNTTWSWCIKGDAWISADYFLSLRYCNLYQDFLDRGLLLTRKLLNQRFLLVKLKFYGRHHDLVDRYGI